MNFYQYFIQSFNKIAIQITIILKIAMASSIFLPTSIRKLIKVDDNKVDSNNKNI